MVASAAGAPVTADRLAAHDRAAAGRLRRIPVRERRPPRRPRPAAPAQLAAPAAVEPAGRRTRRRTSCRAGSGSRSSGSPTRGACRTRRRTSCRPGSRGRRRDRSRALPRTLVEGASVADRVPRAEGVITLRSSGTATPATPATSAPVTSAPVTSATVTSATLRPARDEIAGRQVDVHPTGPAADRDAVLPMIAASAMTGHGLGPERRDRAALVAGDGPRLVLVRQREPAHAEVRPKLRPVEPPAGRHQHEHVVVRAPPDDDRPQERPEGDPLERRALLGVPAGTVRRRRRARTPRGRAGRACRRRVPRRGVRQARARGRSSAQGI